MPDKVKIADIADGSGFTLIGEPLQSLDGSGNTIVFVRAKKEAISVANQINQLQKRLTAEGILAKIVAPNQGDEKIEMLLSASLKAYFPDLNPILTLASGLDGVLIWIRFPVEIEVSIERNVQDVTQRLLNQLGINNAILKFETEKNYPSPTACLRILRRNAPCSPDELALRLNLPGFDQMSPGEVQRFLDTARRKGLVVRREDGRYILSLECLMKLGSSRDRFSPDVSRALALRRLGA